MSILNHTAIPYDMAEDVQPGATPDSMFMAQQAALAAVGDLVKALEHARESIQLWADIASDASQTRHDPSDDIARIDAALKSVKEPPAPPPLTPSIPDRR